MDLTIHLKNTVEPPHFLKLKPMMLILISPLMSRPLLPFVQAGTDDFDKDINVSLNTDQKDGKYFETVSSDGNRTEFRFFLPLILKIQGMMASTISMKSISQ